MRLSLRAQRVCVCALWCVEKIPQGRVEPPEISPEPEFFFKIGKKSSVGNHERNRLPQFIFESYGWIVPKKLSKIPSNIRFFAHNFVIFCQIGNRKKSSVANHESCPNPVSDFVS